MLILWIGLAGGVVCAFGAHFALRSYEAETRAAAERRKEEKALRDELVAARAKSEATEQKRKLQLEKQQAISKRIAEAIEEGGSIKYKFEHARNTDPKRFHSEFQTVHVAAIEKWRAKTASLLDEVLPAYHLGTSFSNIDGKRGESGDVYQFTKLEACMDMLRGVLRDLPNYVEQMIP